MGPDRRLKAKMKREKCLRREPKAAGPSILIALEGVLMFLLILDVKLV